MGHLLRWTLEAAMDTVEVDFEKVRDDFEAFCDRVTGDCEIVYVSRGGDCKDVAIIAADELRSILETLHIIGTRANAERFWQALDRADAGETRPMTIEELKREVGLA
jgi:antitoxin YefM